MASEESSNPESELSAEPGTVAPSKKTKAKASSKKADAAKEGEDTPKRPKVEVTPPENPESGPQVVTSAAVEATISAFTSLDQSGDRRAMNELAQRLGKEQPALLQFAAVLRTESGSVGEAAVFYGTLVWAMYERHLGGKAPRLMPENLEAAKVMLEKEWASVSGFADKPVHERVGAELQRRQPHLVTKLMELIEEDVREEALAEDAAAALFGPTQVIVEAFHGAVTGARPGQNLAPVKRLEPKTGRNDPCHCGSGKKFKRCHGG